MVRRPTDQSPCLPLLGSSFDLDLRFLILLVWCVVQVLQNDIDLLNPPKELEKLKHKKKHLVQSPNSFFMVSNSPSLQIFSLLFGIILTDVCLGCSLIR